MTESQPAPRRRFQFRLMLVLLLMTLACVVACWLKWESDRARLDADSDSMGPDPYKKERMMREFHPQAFKNRPPLPDWPPMKRDTMHP